MFEEEMKILKEYKEAVEAAAKELGEKAMEAFEAISKFENVDKEVAAAMIIGCAQGELAKHGRKRRNDEKCAD